MKYFNTISKLNIFGIKIIGIKKNKLISKAIKQLIQQLVEIINIVLIILIIKKAIWDKLLLINN